LPLWRPHVIADYIEKLNNDINIVDIEDNEFSVKYTYFRLLLIILMIYVYKSKK
jgi:hypothetical protein